jgi:hypothetical protein
MQIRNNFNMEIKPYEWLYMIAAIVIIILVIRGDMQTAIEALTKWLPKPK